MPSKHWEPRFEMYFGYISRFKNHRAPKNNTSTAYTPVFFRVVTQSFKKLRKWRQKSCIHLIDKYVNFIIIKILLCHILDLYLGTNIQDTGYSSHWMLENETRSSFSDLICQKRARFDSPFSSSLCYNNYAPKNAWSRFSHNSCSSLIDWLMTNAI